MPCHKYSIRAFFEGTNEITFSDEGMEVGYPDHRRPLYLAISMNQIPIRRALVDKDALVNLIPFSSLQARGISKSRIQGYPMIQRKGRVHGRIHIAMAEGRPDSLFSSLPCGKNRGLVPHTARTDMVA